MFRTVRLSTICLSATLMVSLYSMQAHALEGFQLGINGGISRLTPETDGSDFSLDDDQSAVISGYVGLDVTPRLSAELAFTDLGEAGLSGGQDISYQAISLGAVAYVWGEAEAEDRSEGLSAYLRLGVSSIDNESNLELDESNNIALWAGAGLQYPFLNNWGVRAEIASFDGDAQALMAGVYWRTGGNSRQSGVAQPSDRTALPTQSREPSTTTQPEQPPASTTTRPVIPVQPTPAPPTQPRATQSASSCPVAARGRFNSDAHCSLLNSVVSGLDFEGDTADITSDGQAVLDRVVSVVKLYPGVTIEIRSHTQSVGDPEQEAQLTALRARSVARYMVQNGVPVSQLSARAFGATQPLPDIRDAAAPANNRIELRTP